MEKQFLVRFINPLFILYVCELYMLQIFGSILLIVSCLSHQIEANIEFTNERRASVTFLPNDHAATSFLEVCAITIFFSIIFSFCCPV